MTRRTIVVDSEIWKVYPTGRVTVYGKDEFGLLFELGTGPERKRRFIRYARGDLVERRVRNLVVLNLGRSFNHLRETLQDFGIGVAAIVVRVLFPIPQTDRDRFGAVGGEERDLVLEAVLLAQHGQDVRFQRPRELRGCIGLELQRDIACVHIDSLATNMNLRTTGDSLAARTVACLTIFVKCTIP